MSYGRRGPFVCMKEGSTLTPHRRGDVRNCRKQLTPNHAPFAHPLHSQVYAAVVYVLLSVWTCLAVFITVRSSGLPPPVQAVNALGNSRGNNGNNTHEEATQESKTRTTKKKEHDKNKKKKAQEKQEDL